MHVRNQNLQKETHTPGFRAHTNLRREGRGERGGRGWRV